MSSKLIIIAILIVAVLAGGYFFSIKKSGLYNTSNTLTPEPSESTNESSQISPTGVSIVINEQNASGESGIATIGESNGKVVVNLKLTGASTQTPQPAHLHSGTCEVLGDVVYPLNNVVNGQSQTVIDADMATLNSKLPLILNVHKSVEEMSVYTSCGQVTP